MPQANRVIPWLVSVVRSRVRPVIGVLLATACVGVGLGLLAGSATGAQHLNGSAYVYWRFDGPGNDFWNVDQEIRINKTGSHTFHALQFTFAGRSNGGYIGIQRDGVRASGQTGSIAIFSIWGADKTRSGSCSPFTETTSGFGCRINWSIKTTAIYRLRVWRLEHDATGQWWAGWVKSFRTGQDYLIGEIHVPDSAGSATFGGVLNFSEYFGDKRSCDKVPVSKASFTNPAANSNGDAAESYQHYSTPRGSDALDCTGHRAQRFRWPNRDNETGVLLTLGGRR